jgi:sensor histidine kinase YesM
LRFKKGFDYSITTNNTIDAGAIFIPPLLLQPFCENAIWHGLMHKEAQGHLSISITEEDGVLLCSIKDDGVGREKASMYKSKTAEKEKSLGLKITTARLQLLNGDRRSGASYRIEDITDEAGNVCGTQVHLEMCYKKAIEENEYA